MNLIFRLMKPISFVTSNTGKFLSFSKVLAQFHLVAEQVCFKLPEPSLNSLEEIACTKVHFAYSMLKKPCVAIDGGFYLDSLHGFPATYAEFTTSKIGVEGYLRLIDGKERGCRFINALAYMDNKLAQPRYFSSSIEGTLAHQERGMLPPEAWSPLWTLFIPRGFKKTLAEMDQEERQDWREKNYSHSTSSLFAQWFIQYSSTA